MSLKCSSNLQGEELENAAEEEKEEDTEEE